MGGKMKTVIVIGMGPAGLSAGMSLLLRGKRVIFLEKYEQNTRLQKILIEKNLLEDFKNLLPPTHNLERTIQLLNSDLNTFLDEFKPENKEEAKLDYQFITAATKNFNICTLKDFQDYQLAKLQFMAKRKDFSFEGDNLHFTGEMQSFRDNNLEILNIDGKNQKITFKAKGETHTIDFDHIVDASGSKHIGLNLLNQNFDSGIIIDKSEHQPKNKHFGIANFKFKKDIQEEIRKRNLFRQPFSANYGSRLNVVDISTLKAIGWKYDFRPTLFLKSDNEGVYILCDVPDFGAAKDPHAKEGLIDFAKKIIEIDLPGMSDMLTPDEQFSSSLFDVEHRFPNKAYCKLGKNGYFFLTGDALVPANPCFGHGLFHAIGDGNALLECFDDTGNVADLKALDENLEERKIYMQSSQQLLESLQTTEARQFSEQKELEAKYNDALEDLAQFQSPAITPGLNLALQKNEKAEDLSFKSKVADVSSSLRSSHG